MNWDPIIPSIVGGLIAGSFAITAQIVATNRTYNNNARLARNQHQKKINGLLQAIKNDVQIACEVFYRKAGKVLEELPEGKPFRTRFSPMDKYLVVYANHTEIVGQIDDNELSRSIMETYKEASYLIGGMEVNNWYLDQIVECQKIQSEGPSSYVNANLANYEKLLTEFAPGLKIGNQKLKEQRENLLGKIDKYLASHGAN